MSNWRQKEDKKRKREIAYCENVYSRAKKKKEHLLSEFNLRTMFNKTVCEYVPELFTCLKGYAGWAESLHQAHLSQFITGIPRLLCKKKKKL